MPTTVLGGRRLDVRPDRVDLRDRMYRPPLRSLSPQHPAASGVADELASYARCGLVLDQGREGACTGFALAALIHYVQWREAAGDRIEPVSARMLYHLARMYDEWPGEDYEGSSCRGAMKGWHRHGVCADALWPYRTRSGAVRFLKPRPGWAEDAGQRPLGAYYRVKSDSVSDLQSALCEVGAVYVSGQVHDGWLLDSSDAWPVEIGAPTGEVSGHAFVLVGYTPRGFIVQNSWGTAWGYHGFAVLRYADWAENGMDAWVAALGAPIDLGEEATADTAAAHRTMSDGRASWSFRSTGRDRRESYRHPNLAPWSEARAYGHTVVLGNDGVPLARLVEVESARDGVHEVVLASPREWLRRRRARKLVIWAHGGLNDEKAGLARARVLGPYLEQNGIYPIFLAWRTGVLESIFSLLEDAARARAENDARSRAGGSIRGAIEAVTGALADARDRTLELVGAGIGGRAIWSQIKQNAEASAEPGHGLHLIANDLASLADALGTDAPLELHLMAHSAGSLLLGHLVTLLSGSIEPRSVTLLAPACTLRFALRHFGGVGPGVKPGAAPPLPPDRLHCEVLRDARERADSVGPYGRSLLYLVSRALEDVHKMPLLGMELAWPHALDRAIERDVWASTRLPELEQWQKYVGAALPSMSAPERLTVETGRGEMPLGHGAFDNDVDLVTRLLERVLGEPLAYPIESLAGF